jgi:hypothetical protein
MFAKFLFLLFWTQLLVIPVFAGKTLTAEQVISEVANEAASSWPDKKIARHLDDVRLRDCMTYGMIADLAKSSRLGPYTQFALQRLVLDSLYLVSAAQTNPPDPNPSPSQVETISGQLKRYIEKSLVSWPNFLCTMHTRWFSNCHTDSPLRPQLGCEKQWFLHPSYDPRIPDVVEDSKLPILNLRFVLDSELQWHYWDFYRGNKVAVFRFVESANGEHGIRDIRYYGLVFCSTDNGTIYRLVTTSAYGPKSRNPGGTSTQITNFEPASIDGTTYYFPAEVVAISHTEKSPFWLRQSTLMTGYHKFNAKSTIHYPPNS